MSRSERPAAVLAPPNLVTASDPYWRAYLRGYGDGYLRGHDQCAADHAAAEAERWDDLAKRVRAMATEPSFLQLAERRDDARDIRSASTQRQLLGLSR